MRVQDGGGLCEIQPSCTTIEDRRSISLISDICKIHLCIRYGSEQVNSMWTEVVWLVCEFMIIILDDTKKILKQNQGNVLKEKLLCYKAFPTRNDQGNEEENTQFFEAS